MASHAAGPGSPPVPPESPEEAARQRRAAWVGLRTLRQRPKLVGHTADGEAVFDVRSVRLVLPANAAHFSRLVHCARCGRDVPGPPVLAPSDLERPSHPVICETCVRSSALPVSRPGDARPVERGRPAPVKPHVEQHTSEPAAAPVEAGNRNGDRLAALEARLEALATRLTELDALQREDSDDLRRKDDVSQAWMHEALQQARAEVGAEVTAAWQTTAAEVAALATSHRALARAQGDLDQRLVELGARIAGLPSATELMAATERRIEEVQAALAVWMGALEQKLHEQAVALTHVVEDQRADLEGMVDKLRLSTQETEARTNALIASPAGQERPEGAGRLVDALERQLEEAETRLARRVGSASDPGPAGPEGRGATAGRTGEVP